MFYLSVLLSNIDKKTFIKILMEASHKEKTFTMKNIRDEINTILAAVSII